jgi:hypothetical protein
LPVAEGDSEEDEQTKDIRFRKSATLFVYWEKNHWSFRTLRTAQ